MTSVPLRIGSPGDYPHVYASFASEYKFSPQGKEMGEKLIRRCLAALLESPNWTLTVACPTVGDEIYAWCLWKPTAVAWVNVKENYRGKGFAKALLKNAGWTGGALKTPFQPPWMAPGVSHFAVKLRPDLLLREILGP